MATSDDMDVQLGRDIAQGGDVQLLHRPAGRLTQFTHPLSGKDDLVHQDRAFGGGQILDLVQTGATRDQDQPWKTGVVLQPHLTQGPVADDYGTGLEGGIGFERRGHPLRSPGGGDGSSGTVQFSA